MYATLIINECIYSRMKKESSCIMCKLDVQKAYDQVNWSFLLNTQSDVIW